MNILHITPAFYPATYWGGPIYSVYGLCNSLAKYPDVNLRVLTTDSAGPRSSESVSVSSFPIRYPDDYSVYFCRRWLGASISPKLIFQLIPIIQWADVVHLTAVYSFPTIPTLITSKILNKPVVWSPRGALQRWECSTNTLAKMVFESTCRLVAPKKIILHVTSEEEAEASRKRFPNFKMTNIPNGVEIPEKTFHIQRKKALRLLFLGRLHPVKGVENLLEACKLLNHERSFTWSLTIAGAGDSAYTSKIQTKIEGLMLSKQVEMVGEAVGEAKEKLFANSDIVVIPSYTENFGMVIAEALAHGVPVIASRGTPWKEAEEKKCGLWVNNSPESLANAIIQLSKKPLNEMGSLGREWMKKEFSWQGIGLKMIDLYRKTISLTNNNNNKELNGHL